ncbi:uncharacterized protein LOC122651058 [Telopea speciosissima]|uniref:uncharacterized protein LOC122651058 n=1 Tax=Telopea speciosissima TaxID=54955 RepID=UPI001CC5FDCA|nr:uncharacterized protein LOC122651058 [Telopea speciosissima]
MAQRQLKHLNDPANNACVSEVIQVGYKFTWDNRQYGKRKIKAKLDRFFTNADWLQLFPEAQVTSDILATSDHRAINLHTDRSSDRRSRPFRMHRKLISLQQVLKNWNKHEVGNIFQNLDQTKSVLTELYNIDPYMRNDHWFLNEKLQLAQLRKLAHQEEILWQQKSRSNWIVNGDRNSKYFHISTMKKRTRNKIRLINVNGTTVTDENQLGQAFIDFFRNLYSSSNPVQENSYFEHIRGRVTREDNDKLT